MKGKSRKNQNMVVAFIIAALIVLFVILFAANRDEPKYELTIKELGGTSMLAISNSQELGKGEIQLNYSEDMPTMILMPCIPTSTVRLPR